VKVEMSIADRFGQLTLPVARASSPDVDLDDPQAARLNPIAHEAILTALVAGYERAKKYGACVETTVVAERMLGTLPGKLAEARQRCQQALPGRALLRGSSP
jgi:hypothetical protein